MRGLPKGRYICIIFGVLSITLHGTYIYIMFSAKELRNTNTVFVVNHI